MKSGEDVTVYQFKLEDLNQKHLNGEQMTKEEIKEFEERCASIKRQTDNYYK